MKNIFVFILGVGVVLVLYAVFTGGEPKERITIEAVSEQNNVPQGGISILPISHASVVLEIGGSSIYVDPVGSSVVFDGVNDPDLILITDIHPDHLNVETLETITQDKTVIIAPQAVTDKLSPALKEKTVVLQNGQKTVKADMMIEAVPMYNLPESPDSKHVKGRGNGYVLEGDGMRVYVAGDTGGIPEMRALENINVAFIPMNLPYTMSVEEAADAVLDFAPNEVYPYHYREENGFSDIEEFKTLVEEGNSNINVVLLNWYRDEAIVEE